MKRVLSAVAVCVPVCLAAAEPPAVPATIDEALAAVRKATGYDRMASVGGPIRLAGTATFLGEATRASLIFDADGRYVREFEGPIRFASGWNGKDAWQTEFSGQIRKLEAGERSEWRLIAAAISGAWLRGDAPLRLRMGKAPATDETYTLDFTFTDGFETGTIEIARETNLPRKWSFGVPGTPQQGVTLEDYADFRGLKLPRRIGESAGHGAASAIQVEKTELAPTFIRSPFDPPGSPREDVKFDSKVAPQLEVVRAPTGHLLVNPKIDGRDAGWFIFDTGAGATVVSKELAAEREFKPIAKVTAVGVGGAVESPMHRLASLSLGPVTIEKPVVVEIDLAFLAPHLGRPIAGVIGYDFISRCVVELELAAAKVALHEPSAYKLSAGNWQPVHSLARHPAVEAKFEGKSGLILLDTGSNQGLCFTTPAVERFKLLEGRETRESTSGGVGGSVSNRIGKVATFEFGGRKFEDLEAGFATQARGALADAYRAGVVGVEILREFKIVLDYTNSRIAFRPVKG